MTKEDFITKSKEIHGSKYDYSKVNYVNSQTKVCIICPEHGEFWQKPNSHLNGCGCPKCGIKQSSSTRTNTTEEFIKESSIIHNNFYDYSKVVYEGKDKKVCIICPKHGEFWQTPHNHLGGHGCIKCKNEKQSQNYKDTLETFIEKARKTHGNKYDYSKVNYIDSQTKICIICPEHGEFWQKPNNHIHGWGCAKCSGMLKKTTEEFINASKEKFGDKYSYEKTKYISNKKRLILTCKEHGDFSVYPNLHLYRGQECPLCSMYRLEKEIKGLLEENSIEYIWQYSNNKLTPQRLDFFLPKQRIAIECQGVQHFMPVKFFGGDEKLEYQKIMDKRKKKICKENGILVLYFTNSKIYNTLSNKPPKDLYFEKEKLLDIIKTRTF